MPSYLTLQLGNHTRIQFVDSSKIEVCHIIRAKRNKVFDGISQHGKGTMGCSFGFKLHLIINHLGEIVVLKLTKVNVDDRKLVTEKLARSLANFTVTMVHKQSTIMDKCVELITTIRKNKKKKLISFWDRAILKRRFIIETVNDQLKNISYTELSRHRSMHGFIQNWPGGLITYCLREKKPSLDLTSQELELLESNNLMLA